MGTLYILKHAHEIKYVREESYRHLIGVENVVDATPWTSDNANKVKDFYKKEYGIELQKLEVVE